MDIKYDKEAVEKSVNSILHMCLKNHGYSFNLISKEGKRDYFSFYLSCVGQHHKFGRIILSPGESKIKISELYILYSLRNGGICGAILDHLVKSDHRPYYVFSVNGAPRRDESIEADRIFARLLGVKCEEEIDDFDYYDYTDRLKRFYRRHGVNQYCDYYRTLTNDGVLIFADWFCDNCSGCFSDEYVKEKGATLCGECGMSLSKY